MQTAVVTGAGRGIGREITRLLGERGLAVLATDVDQRLSEETALLCGDPAWSMKLDVRDPEAHVAIAAAARERGPIAVWVNNAAVLRTGPAWDHSQEDLRLMVDTNVLGVILGSTAAVEAMPDGGDILNIASEASFTPPPGMAIYASTKHAVLGFSLALRADLERIRSPLRVHVFCPGAVDTEMVWENAESEHSAAIFGSGKPLPAADVAAAAVSLVGSGKALATYPRLMLAIPHLLSVWPRLSLRLVKLATLVGEPARRRAREKHFGKPVI